jgi:hypothetical protein
MVLAGGRKGLCGDVPTVGDPPRNPVVTGLPSLPSGHERLPRGRGEAW